MNLKDLTYELHPVKNAGDLKKFLADIPDDTSITIYVKSPYDENGICTEHIGDTSGNGIGVSKAVNGVMQIHANQTFTIGHH